MVGAVDGVKARAVNMGVHLSGRNRGVSEHLLDRPDVRSVRKKIRREAVPQHVRRHRVRVHTRRSRTLAQHLENAHAREGTPQPREEDAPLRRVAAREGFARRREVARERRRCGNADRNNAFLRPLATATHYARVRDNVLQF